MGLYNEIAAATILRVILGILFFLQGYDKVFRVGIKSVIETFEYPMKSKNIPPFILVLSAYYTSFAELLGGLFLILGFMKNYSLYLLGIDLIMVSTALGMLKPMWDMEHVFPRLVILIALLLIPDSWDILSLDQLIK